MRRHRGVPNATGLETAASREAALLAPYAMHSRDSAGRRHAEPAHPYRSPYQRDRDRILHCAAFRRLSGKMQVFTGDRGDYHRTRLTHTMEVASIARTLGRTLRLNEDLIEALALLHDIGHPPFGHAGEEALDECLANEGGFSHNRFALTLVEELEQRYPRFAGLNLSYEVLQGQWSRVDDAHRSPGRLLEVQVVDVADSITYNAHDVDDAIKLGLVTTDELVRIPLAGESAQRARDGASAMDPSMLRKAMVHELIDGQVSDVLRTSAARLGAGNWPSAQAARAAGPVIGPSEDMSAKKMELEAFLHKRVYRHPQLIRVRSKAKEQLREMLEGFVIRAELLPTEYLERSKRVGLRRSAADFLAGMTDRFCVQLYREHFS